MKRPLLLATALTMAAGCVVGPQTATVQPGSQPSASSAPTAAPPVPTAMPATPAPTPSPVATPSAAATTAPSPVATASASASPTPAATPSPSASATASPTPKPPTIHTRTIQPQTSQTISIPAVDTLEIEARLDALMDGAPLDAMAVYVNNQLIRHAVSNRASKVMTADGQEHDLFDSLTNHWLLPVGPNFTSANTPAAGNHQMTSDPGQAYRYVWNVAAQKGSNWLMAVRIDNDSQGQQLPLVVRVYQR